MEPPLSQELAKLDDDTRDALALMVEAGYVQPLEPETCALCGGYDPRPCRDCAAPTFPHEIYMLRNEVWDATGCAPDGGSLCVGCAEKRLGRELTAADFHPEWLVDRYQHPMVSARLAARMSLTGRAQHAWHSRPSPMA
jgi:hypothetical protein